MGIFGNFFKGFDGNSFRAVGSLMMTNMKKQIFVWVMVALVLLSTFAWVGLFAFVQLINGGDYIPATLISSKMGTNLITSTLIPLSLITIFAIPSIMNSIHKSTMVKRIGATKISEQSFITMVWLVFLIFTLVFTSIVYFVLLSTFTTLFGFGVINHWLLIYLYILVVIILFVSLGVLLGTLPIGTVSSTVISLSLLFLTFLVGGAMPSVSTLFTLFFPKIARVILMINPLALASYGMTSMISGTGNATFTTFTILYVLMISVVFFFGSTMTMSFNKIR